MKRMNSGMTYDQKEIVLIPFPYSDLTGAKQRPALIVSNQNLNNSEDRMCCLVTSKEAKDGLRISSESFREGELPFESWVKPHRVFTVSEKIVRKTLCVLNDDFHSEVVRRINKYLK